MPSIKHGSEEYFAAQIRDPSESHKPFDHAKIKARMAGENGEPPETQWAKPDLRNPRWLHHNNYPAPTHEEAWTHRKLGKHYLRTYFYHLGKYHGRNNIKKHSIAKSYSPYIHSPMNSDHKDYIGHGHNSVYLDAYKRGQVERKIQQKKEREKEEKGKKQREFDNWYDKWTKERRFQ